MLSRSALSAADEALILAETILATIRHPFLVLDRDLRVVSANRAFYDCFHVTPTETEGRLVYALGNGQWNIAALRDALERVLPEQHAFEDYFVEHDFEAIGRRVMRLSGRVLRRGGDRPDLILLGIEDVTEDIAARKHGASALAESTLWFGAMADNIPQLAWMARPDGRVFWYNKRWYDYTGATLEDMQSHGWGKVNHPDHVERVTTHFRRQVEAGEPWEDTFPLRGKDGDYRWFLSHAVPIRDGTGKLILWFGTSTDITEQLKTQERLKLLAAEVDHRAKNMLTLVQVIVRQTRAETVQDFVRAVTGRINALARVQTLLAGSRWQGADLRRLVEEELAPFRPVEARRVHLDGPTVTLQPRAAQSFAMALHELATNAAKYGALSVPQGAVTIEWVYDAQGRLALRWTETGGPAIEPPKRNGMGTGVVERSVENGLGGEVRFNWRSEGLVCEITVPTDKVCASPAMIA